MTGRIKILELCGITCGGSAGHVLTLVRDLPPERFDVTVAYTPGGPLDEQFVRSGVRLAPIGFDHFGGIRKNLQGLWQLFRLMRSERYDIVHTHTSVAGAIGRLAAWLSGTRCTIHMVHAYASHANVPRFKRYVYRAVERLLDPFTSFYIAGSDAIAQVGPEMKIMRREKIFRIYYGIDIHESDRERAAGGPDLRQEFGIAKDSPLVGFVGRIEEQKGLCYLIESAKEIVRVCPSAMFLIVGDGSLRAECEAAVAQAGLKNQFRFVGWRHDIPRVMAAIDLLAVPSLWEAFGLVAAEAMAAEKPVVASRIEGLAEVVAADSTGLLVPPRDPSAFAAATMALLSDPKRRKDMGERGRERAVDYFSHDQMVKLHQQCFEDAVGDASRAVSRRRQPVRVSVQSHSLD